MRTIFTMDARTIYLRESERAIRTQIDFIRWCIKASERNGLIDTITRDDAIRVLSYFETELIQARRAMSERGMVEDHADNYCGNS